MRVTIALVSVLSIAGWSRAPASEPPTSPAQPTVSAPAGQQSASPAPTAPTAAAAKSDTGKPELTAEDKDLIARGYKLKMRDGEKWFCKREAEIGSHLERLNCNTAESIVSQRASAAETLRVMQANKSALSN